MLMSLSLGVGIFGDACLVCVFTCYGVDEKGCASVGIFWPGFLFWSVGMATCAPEAHSHGCGIDGATDRPPADQRERVGMCMRVCVCMHMCMCAGKLCTLVGREGVSKVVGISCSHQKSGSDRFCTTVTDFSSYSFPY